jgi:uncharacterized protein YbjT (DUF2867 family)
MPMAGSDSTSTVLVTGATGRHGGTGAHLVQGLRQVGRQVRVLVRRKDERAEALEELGATIAVGDLHDRASLVAALDGVESVYFTYPIRGGVVEAAAAFASAATEAANSPRVVVMSMITAQPDSPSALCRAQWLAEEVLRWSGLDLLVLRVGALFYENVVTFHSRSIREECVIRNNFGDVPSPWISAQDAAALALAALVHPERFSGASVQYPPGSELLSQQEMAELMSLELDRPISYQAVSRAAWRRELDGIAETDPAGVVNAEMAPHISALAEALATRGEAMSPPDTAELQRLIGRPPFTFREFVRQQRAALTGQR